ncbi:MAG: hypothetical protein HKN25_14100 [Pyrinomonadaceae bacterium]|nr:hypothetical protein [Pyrinomonadaceae bacterium]
MLAFAENIQLVPDGTILIHIAMILVMIWILNRTFFRPINRIIEAREKNKGGHSTEAKSILQDVSSKESEYAQGLLEARNEGYELIESGRKEAIAKKNAKVESAKKEVAQFVETENSELDKQIAEAENLISEEAKKMADQISSNILKSA